MADVPPNRLCAALAALAPGRVLQMGTRREVQQGIRGFAERVVQGDRWVGKDAARFMAGAAPVTVSLDDSDRLRPHCEPCGGSACPHVVAVMATCVHVIRGKSSFTTHPLRPGAFDPINAFLRNGHTSPEEEPNPERTPKPATTATATATGPSRPGVTGPTVKSSPAVQQIKIRIIQNGIGQVDVVCKAPRVSLSMRGNASYGSPSAMRLLPRPVRELFSVPVMNPDELEQDFFRWAAENVGTAAIVIDELEAAGVAPVEKILTAAPMVAVSFFRRRIGRREVEAWHVLAPAIPDSEEEEDGAVADLDQTTGDFYQIGRSLAYLPEQRALAYVAFSALWQGHSGDLSPYVIHRVRTLASQVKNRPFPLNAPRISPIAAFNQNALDAQSVQAAAAGEGLVRYFDADNETPVVPGITESSASILVEPRPDAEGYLLAFRLFAASHMPGAIDEAAEFLDVAETYFKSSQRRLTAFRSLLGKYLLSPSQRERKTLVKEFFAMLGPSSRLEYETGEVFSDLEKAWSQSGNVVVASESVGPEVPSWVSVDIRKPAFQLLGLVYRYFPGLDYVPSDDEEERPDEAPMTDILVPQNEWRDALPAFAAHCVQLGVELTVSGRKVEPVALNLRIVAEGVAGTDSEEACFKPDRDRIDWFALRPEVLCGDASVPQEQWMEMIRNGTLESAEGNQDGILQVIDPDSLERFALFLRAGASMGSGGAQQKDGLVRIPRLQILDWIHLKTQGVSVELPVEEAAMIDSLLSGEPSQPATMPEMANATLRPYQEAGYRWLAFLYQHRFGAVLADDMGLGKTLQAITLFAAIEAGLVRRSGKLPHLAVLPPSLVFNWQSEIERFAPQLKIYEYTGAKRSLEKIDRADVVLTTYELARRDIEKLEALKFDVIIFDEAQTAKNLLAARSKAIRRLDGRFRLCLTGTPLENHVGEYFAILDLALPGLLGEPEAFRKAMQSKATENGTSARYLRRAKPFVLRRTKEKVLKDLPPKIESDIYLDLDRAQKEYYTRTVAEIRKEVARAFRHKPQQQAGIVALTALMRLRQICVAPSVIDPSIKADSPKVSYLVGKLQELHEEGYAALVFSQFTRVLDVVEKQLKEAELGFLRLDGKTPQKMRKKRVDDFQADDGPGIFLISLKAGGAGLNLTRAAYVFHLDPWWNPAVERQASDRAHRIGQTQTVFIHRILMRGTIEEKMMVLKARKQELYDEIMGVAEAEADRVQSRKSPMITREDIGFLLEK